MNKKYLSIGGVLGAILAFGFFSGAYKVIANQFEFGQSATTATATTTVAFMSPGAATTTIVYDSLDTNGSNQTFHGNASVPNSAMVLAQITGSSTAASVNMTLEFSMDKVDWFKYTNVGATTTPTVTVNNIYTYSIAALGDLDGAQAGTASTTRRAIAIDNVPTRYVRAVFTVPAGGVNAAVWAQIVPKKQRAQ